MFEVQNIKCSRNNLIPISKRFEWVILPGLKQNHFWDEDDNLENQLNKLLQISGCNGYFSTAHIRVSYLPLLIRYQSLPGQRREQKLFARCSFTLFSEALIRIRNPVKYHFAVVLQFQSEWEQAYTFTRLTFYTIYPWNLSLLIGGDVPSYLSKSGNVQEPEGFFPRQKENVIYDQVQVVSRAAYNLVAHRF